MQNANSSSTKLDWLQLQHFTVVVAFLFIYIFLFLFLCVSGANIFSLTVFVQAQLISQRSEYEPNEEKGAFTDLTLTCLNEGKKKKTVKQAKVKIVGPSFTSEFPLLLDDE